MASLTKAVLTFDDGSTQEFDAASAPVAATIQDVEVVNSDGSTETFTPEQTASTNEAPATDGSEATQG